MPGVGKTGRRGPLKMNNTLPNQVSAAPVVSSAERAYKAGKTAREKGLMRVSPYYEVREIRDGRRVDVTSELDRCFFEGYDGVPMTPEVPPANVPSRVIPAQAAIA
jgi:hypothetical protein